MSMYHVYEGCFTDTTLPQDNDLEGSGFLGKHLCVCVREGEVMFRAWMQPSYRYLTG